PGAADVCNGVDDDCDGAIDEGAATTTWYADADGDGFGDASATVRACAPPPGFVANADDCDDTDAAINPDAAEVCNEVDDDCDGAIDEGAIDDATWYADADGDGFGDPAVSQQACRRPAGTVSNDDDCDDTRASVHPGAPEVVADGIDQNCDGVDTCYHD